ncbi:hypothetical protein WN55_03575 [Dufourea novaeangliae]|uniref:Uncharacterized protein n=1 Tax=Dufourea novaeangliae TaxID=178035 RepID=A0A154PIS9_DUFNO|nr:hypothetical protein WN55_03575 [Dufourea novaeangliae]
MLNGPHSSSPRFESNGSYVAPHKYTVSAHSPQSRRRRFLPTHWDTLCPPTTRVSVPFLAFHRLGSELIASRPDLSCSPRKLIVERLRVD